MSAPTFRINIKARIPTPTGNRRFGRPIRTAFPRDFSLDFRCAANSTLNALIPLRRGLLQADERPAFSARRELFYIMEQRSRFFSWSPPVRYDLSLEFGGRLFTSTVTPSPERCDRECRTGFTNYSRYQVGISVTDAEFQRYLFSAY